MTLDCTILKGPRTSILGRKISQGIHLNLVLYLLHLVKICESLFSEYFFQHYFESLISRFVSKCHLYYQANLSELINLYSPLKQ